MSIDVTKLENVKHILKNGEKVIIARCPACAEGGTDDTGNHLIIFQDGRFGCVVNRKEDPYSRQHRRRVLELAGNSTLRVNSTDGLVFRPTVKMLGIEKKERVYSLFKKA